MTDISTLLQEAKPLYKERKQRRKQLQACLVVLLCLGGISLNNRPNTDLNFNIDEELYLTETGGAIEDLGLPTDEFGLLKVV